MAAQAAGAATVILVRPENPKPITAEALVRMHGELVSVGFDVQIVASSAGTDPRASLEQTASGSGRSGRIGMCPISRLIPRTLAANTGAKSSA